MHYSQCTEIADLTRCVRKKGRTFLDGFELSKEMQGQIRKEEDIFKPPEIRAGVRQTGVLIFESSN